MKADDVGRLVEGLAAVTIAGLVAGNPVAAVAVAAATPTLIKVLKRNVETSNQLSQISNAITAWAGGENIDGNDLFAGLAIATETMSRHGLIADQFKDYDYNADQGTDEVIRRARSSNPSWAATRNDFEDAGHVVARKAIRATLTGIASRHHSIEATLLAALRQEFRDAHTDWAKFARAMENDQTAVEDVHTDVQALVQQLIAAGTVADVSGYLRTRIADWDVSVWHPHLHAPSKLEQRLYVRSQHGGRLTKVGTATEALAGQKMVVVLGGPGSGKSWLARRHAREAAQAALDLLESGADLESVELPVLTTWDRWNQTRGHAPDVELRMGLVAASFASELGNSDLGGRDSTARLQRTLSAQDTKVLLIVDSLDEAAERSTRSETDSLRALSSIRGWRLVTTSRPAAWDAIAREEFDGPGGPRVVELQDLTYPDDVEAFIHEWFVKDPVRGQDLVDQIWDRRELQRPVLVPLILTFYCLLAEEEVQDAQRRASAVRAGARWPRPLPIRRRELYQDLVKRLLMGEWDGTAPGPDAAADVEDCEALLIGWAGQAVCNWGGVSADLRSWGDEFQQPTRPRQPERMARAIDHIAPKQSRDAKGGTTRRFVHRTIFEHFVAEHLATLSSDDAAEILLPHLWFDTNWKVAAPAAIAAHNQKYRGKLLEKILQYADRPTEDLARKVAAIDFDEVLLAIAEESEPEEWQEKHQRRFHQCRIRNATTRPDWMARTAHWTESNASARSKVLAALSSVRAESLVAALPSLVATTEERAAAYAAVQAAMTSNPANAENLATGLPALATTNTERAEALTKVLAALKSADSRLLDMLPALVTNRAERDRARSAVVLTLTSSMRASSFGLPRVTGGAANGVHVQSLAKLWTALAPSGDERREARAAVMKALATCDNRLAVGQLVSELPALTSSSDERSEARAAVMKALTSANPFTIGEIVGVLPALTPSSDERREARAAVMKALTSDDPWTVGKLLSALPAMDPIDAECVQAIAAAVKSLTTALASPHPLTVSLLVAGLPALATTNTQRELARAGVLKALSSCNGRAAGELAALLPALVTTDTERELARAGVLKALSSCNGRVAGEVGAVLSVLATTDTERELARAGVLTAMSSADSWAVCELVGVLSTLSPLGDDLADARIAVMKALTSADMVIVGELVSVLSSLDPTTRERDTALTTIIKVMQAPRFVSINETSKLVVGLLELHPTYTEREEAIAVVVKTLSAATSITDELANWGTSLSALANTATERTLLRAGVLSALTTARPWVVKTLVSMLPALAITKDERAEARTAVLAELSFSYPSRAKVLVPALRSLSSTKLWLRWLVDTD